LRCKPSSRWHLDEMVVRINGKQTYLWRAVDDEGEVLEVLIQSRRNKAAASKLIRKLGFQAQTPEAVPKISGCGERARGRRVVMRRPLAGGGRRIRGC